MTVDKAILNLHTEGWFHIPTFQESFIMIRDILTHIMTNTRYRIGSGCREWIGHRDRHGYGRISVKKYGDRRLTHRVAFQEAHGVILHQTTQVNHHCDNPACVALTHLWPGTQKDNMRDCARKGRLRQQKERMMP